MLRSKAISAKRRREIWPHMKWDDIKIFLAVAAEGSTLAASRKLDLNQTTVSRRIGILEHNMSLVLFHREVSGYKLTLSGEQFFEACRPAVSMFNAIAAKAGQLGHAETELVRITSPAEAMSRWLSPILQRFRARNPTTTMEMDGNESKVDLIAGEADIAVRFTDQIDDERLIARRIPSIGWAVYCSRATADANDMPRDIDSLAGRAVVHYVERLAIKAHPMRWFGTHLSEADIKLRVSSVPGMAAALQSEDAVGILPTIVGDNMPELVCCFRHEALRHNGWLVTTPAAYARPIVRKCMKQIAREFPRDL
jgi:DNA-binding transcriptional LysR family regulator